MMIPRRTSITITTAADGSATVYSDKISGFIEMVGVVVGTLTTGFDFTLTTETTLQTLLAETAPGDAEIFYPRQLVNSAADGALGSQLIQYGTPIANERIKCVVANGGNAKTGSLTIIYQGVTP